MDPRVKDLIDRAEHILRTSEFNPLADNSVIQYRLTVRRLSRRSRTETGAYPPLSAKARNTDYVQRAAWRRGCHLLIASALEDLRDGEGSPQAAFNTLKQFVAEVDALDALGPWSPPESGAPLSQSKRKHLAKLPRDWMAIVFAEAVRAKSVHLDAIAVLIAAGCRPQEVCIGCVVRATASDVLKIRLEGAKVSDEDGQPWRELTMKADHPAAAHLLDLAQGNADGVCVKASCSPNAISTRVSVLVRGRFAHRISCQDFRHQRASDVRATSAGDMDLCARWLGHASTATARYYGRLPRSSGSYGPTPLAAEAPRPVRRPGPRVRPAPDQSAASTLPTHDRSPEPPLGRNVSGTTQVSTVAGTVLSVSARREQRRWTTDGRVVLVVWKASRPVRRPAAFGDAPVPQRTSEQGGCRFVWAGIVPGTPLPLHQDDPGRRRNWTDQGGCNIPVEVE